VRYFGRGRLRAGREVFHDQSISRQIDSVAPPRQFRLTRGAGAGFRVAVDQQLTSRNEAVRVTRNNAWRGGRWLTT
jgi:hypothetical protein